MFHCIKQKTAGKKFTGELLGWEDDNLLIREQDNILSFSRDEVAVVRLAVEF